MSNSEITTSLACFIQELAPFENWKKTFEMFEIFQSRLFPSSRPSKLDYPWCFSSHCKNSTPNSVKITVSMLKHIQMRCERGQLVTFIPIHLSFLTLFFSNYEIIERWKSHHRRNIRLLIYGASSNWLHWCEQHSSRRNVTN